MDEGLPLNRKERFFTGTVFPMIICAEGGKYFGRFTEMLPLPSGMEIDWRPESTNIQFFTEYSLLESVYAQGDADRFPDAHAAIGAKDTPDIVMLVTEPEKALICLEAKMFLRVSASELAGQMDRQAEIVRYLGDKLAVPEHRRVHAALIPAALAATFRAFPYHVLSWDALHETFVRDRDPDYFLEILRISLDRWEALTGPLASFGKNADDKITGIAIYKGAVAETLPFKMMGRGGGVDGPKLASDLQSGTWSRRKYEVRFQPLATQNPNWFPIELFVERIDSLSAIASEDEQLSGGQTSTLTRVGSRSVKRSSP